MIYINKLLQNMYLLKINFRNYRHLTQVFLLVKVTLAMIDHKISFKKYFNQLTKLLQLFLVFQTQFQNGNLKGCQMKQLIIVLQKIIVFLQN